MFEVLVESGVRQSGRIGPRVASISVHGLALIAAGLGWRQSAGEASRKPVAVSIDIFEAPVTRPSSRERINHSGPSTGSPLPGPPAPIAASITSPPIALDLPGPEPAVSPLALVQRELRSGWGRRESGPVDSMFLAGEVDEVVTILSAAKPEYPGIMAAAAVSGEVRLEFVVDTAGRCQASSVRVLSSTASAFESPAIDAVVATVYRAARVRGRPVRQLVQQRVTFRLK